MRKKISVLPVLSFEIGYGLTYGSDFEKQKVTE